MCGQKIRIVGAGHDASTTGRSQTGIRVRAMRTSPPQTPGVIELAADYGAVEIKVPRAADKFDANLPFRVAGFNPRWSAILWQKDGYIGAGRYAISVRMSTSNRKAEAGIATDSSRRSS